MQETGQQTTQTQSAGVVDRRIPKIPSKVKGMGKNLIVTAVLVVLAGVGTGWWLSGSGGFVNGSKTAPGAQVSQNEAGIADESTFRDTAEGIIESGGIDGEGTHHLVREGGEAKYVYLTSTVIDLESFVGKRVQVWGETISAQTAPWLMDVGKVKVAD